jgi:tripartite-type tricarboxylate transporter receptor subunit TctC
MNMSAELKRSSRKQWLFGRSSSGICLSPSTIIPGGVDLKGALGELGIVFLGFFLLAGVSSLAHGADKPYPNRPINMIVPFAAGGGADLSSKPLADKMAEFLGEPLISVYKPGASGALGAAFVAKAKPDGYTVLVGGPSLLAVAPVVKKLDYKLDDFVFASGYATNVVWMAVKADARWKNLKEFVEEARKNPGKLTVSSYGKLSLADYVIMFLNKYANIKLIHVPYKATGEALTAVLGGHANAGVTTGSGGLLESGSIRILAAAEEKRLDVLPDIPTFTEYGYPINIRGYYSFSFPKGTPADIVQKFTNAQQKAFDKYSKEIKEALLRLEIFARMIGPEEILNMYKADWDRYSKLSAELGLIEK